MVLLLTNDGAVPNHVQVLGGGRCLVHFTPEYPKSHTIDIKFNGEPVPGCPFVCQIADTSKHGQFIIQVVDI